MTTRTARTPGHAQAGNRIRLRIAGMSCSSCVDNVRSALAGVAGLRVLDVRPGSAVIELQPDVDGYAVVRAITTAGYEVSGITPVDAREEFAMRTDPVSGGGCCCGSETAHRAVSRGTSRP